MATRKPKDTKKTAKDIEGNKGYISKSDVAAARGKEPNGPPTTGRLSKGKSQAEQIIIPAPKWRWLTMMVTGEVGSSLVVHKWDKKAIEEILRNHMGLPKLKKEKKDPFLAFLGTLYSHEDGGYGFPSVAFKASAVAACRYIDGVPMTTALGSFHVMGDLTQLRGIPNNRLDPTRVGGKGRGTGVADMRFRGEFKEWAAVLRIRFLENVISAEQIINLFNHAGSCVGVGEWRPEKNGNKGMYRVVAEDEVKEILDRIPIADRDAITQENSGTLEILRNLELLEAAIAA
jgi:hypothetical protein